MASMKTSVSSGSDISTSIEPTIGTASSSMAPNRKAANSAVKASGRAKKMRKPARTQMRALARRNGFQSQRRRGDGGDHRRGEAKADCIGPGPSERSARARATRSRSTRSKWRRVVRLEHRGVARQVEVPQARDPEAQRAGAQHRRQQPQLGAAERAHARRRRRRSALGARRRRARPVARSMHQSFRHTAMSNSQRVDAGEIEVEEAGQRARLLEHHVVAEQVGVDRRRAAAPRRPADAATCCWKASSSASSARLRGVEVAAAPPARSRSTRPGRAGWAGAREVARRRGACAPASRRPRRSAPASGASSVLPAQPVRPPPPACRCSACRMLAASRRPCGSGTGMPRWPGASSGAGRTAAARRQALEQRQHVVARGRCRRSSWCSRCRRWMPRSSRSSPEAERARAARAPRRTRLR